MIAKFQGNEIQYVQLYVMAEDARTNISLANYSKTKENYSDFNSILDALDNIAESISDRQLAYILIVLLCLLTWWFIFYDENLILCLICFGL